MRTPLRCLLPLNRRPKWPARWLSAVLLLAGAPWLFAAPTGDDAAGERLNSLGMVMARLPAGSFAMGNTNSTPAELNGPPHLALGDWDERPLHRVTLSHSFYMSRTEVTEEQYRRFDPAFKTLEAAKPYAAGMSWNDAASFCQWLSRKEGKNYRLPTEAEWEYACRAGTETLFSSGDKAPGGADYVNAWGLQGMQTSPVEWCLDWHGGYPYEPQKDPVGPERGIARVVRGGGLSLHWTPGKPTFDPYYPEYYARSANRAGVIPSYRGELAVGFRVVRAPMPKAKPLGVEAPFIQQSVLQGTEPARRGPDPKQPYFKRRLLLPIPPDNSPPESIPMAGLHPAILRHNHSPALEVCPNGDVLAVYFTCVEEYTADVALLAARLRFGSEQWDMPEILFDLPDIIEASPLLWNDNGNLQLFWGGPATTPDVVLRLATSQDNGATWSDIRFIKPSGSPPPAFRPQPITSALRGLDGTMYVACDGKAADTFLWASRDNGQTWSDTGGRTGGRHTAIVALKDGSLFGMGGKSSDIDGYNTQSVSTDGAKTWKVSKSPFAALGSNQRPTMIKLASGRLFVAGDFQDFNGKQPEGITNHGSFVALSDDEGKSWHIKTLVGTLPHESRDLSATAAIGTPGRAKHEYSTLGYCVARQAPNGVIHLITSMNHPSLHFEMNEAWILNDRAGYVREACEGQTVSSREVYPNGKPRVTWSAKSLANGGYLLHGKKTCAYPNGAKQWEVTYQDGRKVGMETFWSAAGKIQWQWDHRSSGTSVWTQWWPNGKKKSESSWRDRRCVGLATRWDPNGRVAAQHQFPQ